MPSGFADLHIHTNKSDSTFSPEKVLSCAVKCGLKAIAITDHDSTSALPFFYEHNKECALEVIPGIELSADYEGEDVHILGLYIDYARKWFLEKLRFLREKRQERAREIVSRLKDMGIKIQADDVIKVSGGGAVGRMHVARMLLEKGYIRNVKEAFARYIGKGRYAYVKKYRIATGEAVDIIKKLGGVSVLAHPAIMNRDDIIPALVNEGISGIEVYHSDHNPSSEKKYLSIAQRYGLLVTGGSDCHGEGKGRMLMGTVKIPYILVERIKKRLGIPL